MLTAKTKPMSAAQAKILTQPTIGSQLPLSFANGFVLKKFEGHCCICSTRIRPDKLHGSITQPFQAVAIIEAIGVCDSCNIAIPFFMRVRDDGTMDWHDSNGNCVQSRAKESIKWFEQKKALVFGSFSILLAYVVAYLTNK